MNGDIRRLWWGGLGLMTSACTTDPVSSRAAPCATPAVVQWVAPAAPVGDADVLSSGFEVPSIELEARQDGSFSIEIADEAIYVTCAAFRCRPQLGTRERAPIDQELFASPTEITNFDTCVVAYDHFVSEHPRVSRDQLRQLPRAPICDDASLDDAQVDLARASARWLGCWVYGQTGIIEASNLLPVPGSSLGPTLATDCIDQGAPARTPPGGWAGCVLPDGGVGMCVDDTCQRWCDHEGCPTAE
ncbi:MAG: hypothetical protein K0V04_26125 [Deltaproteobacteria bacterium]|nr:hypothetical protein [Deltaproteobacteria bacterium]